MSQLKQHLNLKKCFDKFENYQLKTLLKYADTDAFINLLLVTADNFY